MDSKAQTTAELEIRERHKVTLLIDWRKEFDPEWQPQSLSNAELCHQDRGTLLGMLDELQAQLTEFTTLPSNVYAPDNVSWQTHAEELKAQLDAVRDAYDYALYRWCEWGERAERCFEFIEQALGIGDIE